MSTAREREAEDAYENQNDDSAPVSGDFIDSSWAHETGGKGFSRGIPVQRDDAGMEDPMQPPFSNSNQQLGRLFCLLRVQFRGSNGWFLGRC